MRTYDYILAMREEGQSFDPFDDDSDLSSDESIDLDSPEKPTLLSRFFCRGHDKDQVTYINRQHYINDTSISFKFIVL